MDECIAATRRNLLQRLDHLESAVRGANLLERRREVLMREFIASAEAALEARRAMLRASREAYMALFLANAWDGPEALRSAGLAAGGALHVETRVEKIFGVELPRLQSAGLDDVGLAFSPLGMGDRTMEAAARFRDFAEAIVVVAASETRLRRIGEEMRQITRRVNVLEQLRMPTIKRHIRSIRCALDQRSLEELVVLKRIESKLESRKQERRDRPSTATG